MEVFWYHIFFIYITKSIFYTKNQVSFFLYNKIDFVISKIDLVILNFIFGYHKVKVLLCIQVSFRILSITNFNCQQPKTQGIY